MPSWPLSRTHDKTTSVLAMQLSLLECRHGKMTSDVACYLCDLRAHRIGRLQVWNDPMALWQHKWLDDVGRGMPSSPFDNTYDQKWHTIISIGQHTQSDHVRRDMRSSHLGNTHGGMTSGISCHHHPWTTYTGIDNVEHGLSSPPLESIQCQTKSGVTFYDCLWTTHKLTRRWVW